MKRAKQKPDAESRSRSRALFARAMLFFAPVFAVFGALELLLWRTGESWPLARVLATQERRRDAIFMRGVLDQSLYAYKWRGFLERSPDVLALGSSRVMKFRTEMFGDEAATFYNAGGLVTSLADLDAFAHGLPDDRAPRVILLGVDSWWMKAGGSGDEPFRVSHDGALSWQEHLLALRTLIQHPRLAAAAAASLLSDPETEEGIGIHAQARGQGFRFDGSLESRPFAPRSGRRSGFVDPDRPTTVKRIRTGAGFFKPSPGVPPARVQELRAALSRLQDRGILVVGFAPPICSDGVRLLESDPRHRRFWVQYREKLARTFDELGLPFVDASSPALLGLDDRYMLDGIHAGETLHVHLLRRMLDDPRVSGALPGAARIVDAAIRSSRTNFWHADIPDRVALTRLLPDES